MWTDGRTIRYDEANSRFSQSLRQRLKSYLLPAKGTGSIAIEQVFKSEYLVCNIGVNLWYQNINCPKNPSYTHSTTYTNLNM